MNHTVILRLHKRPQVNVSIVLIILVGLLDSYGTPPLELLLYTAAHIVIFTILVLISYLLGKLLEGNMSFSGIYTVLGYAQLLSLLELLPGTIGEIITILALVWMTVIAVYTMHVQGRLSVFYSAITVLAPLAIFFTIIFTIQSLNLIAPFSAGNTGMACGF